MSREKTKEEVRQEFIDMVKARTHYWATAKGDMTVQERCEGVAFSLMNIFDGTSGLPAFDIVVRPHPADKQFHIDEGDDYYPDGMVINDDCYLHNLV